MKRVFAAAVISLFIAGTWASSAGAVDQYVEAAPGTCHGKTPCRTTVSAAVANATPGDTIFIYPGTYNEWVDLMQMGPRGNITLTGIDETGEEWPGLATISTNAAGQSPLGCKGSSGTRFVGNITVRGLNLSSTAGNDSGVSFGFVEGDILLEGVSATGQGRDGIGLYNIYGNVELRRCWAMLSHDDGFRVSYCSGDVTMIDCFAMANMDGIALDHITGVVKITNCTSQGNLDDGFDIESRGNVTLIECSAHHNGGSGTNDEDGFQIRSLQNVSIENCSAFSNAQEGFDIESADWDVYIVNSLANDNGGEGIDMDALGIHLWVSFCQVANNGGTGIEVAHDRAPSGNVSINCNDIHQNAEGIHLYQGITVDAANNWWGDPSGPTHPNNVGGSGDSVVDGSSGGSGTVAFRPWESDPDVWRNCPSTAPPIMPPAAVGSVKPQAVPTMTEWGSALMALLLLTLAVRRMRRRREA